MACKKRSHQIIVICCALFLCAQLACTIWPKFSESAIFSYYKFRNYPAVQTFYLGHNVPADARSNYRTKYGNDTPNKPWFLTKIGTDERHANIAKHDYSFAGIIANVGDKFLTIADLESGIAMSRGINGLRYRIFDATGKEIAHSDDFTVSFARWYETQTSTNGTASIITAYNQNFETAGLLQIAIAKDSTVSTSTKTEGAGGTICDDGQITWIRNRQTVVTESFNGQIIAETPILDVPEQEILRSGFASCDHLQTAAAPGEPSSLLRLRSQDETAIYSWELKDGFYRRLPDVHLLQATEYERSQLHSPAKLQQRSAIFANYAIGIDRSGLLTQTWFRNGETHAWQAVGRTRNGALVDEVLVTGVSFTPTQIVVVYRVIGQEKELLQAISPTNLDCTSKILETGFSGNRFTTQIIPHNYLAPIDCI